MTQPYELVGDEHENAVRAFHNRQSAIQTAMPGIIQSFDPVAMTCVVQPAIKAVVFAQDGTSSDVALPLLLDCPVFFPSGGGCTLTFPVKKDDECLVVFSSRCIDAWWFSGGIQSQAELRMHDLSDGFALVGVRSQPRVLSGVSTSTVQLRSDDGAAFVSVDPSSHEVDITTSGIVNITAAGNVNVQAASANVTASGAATVTAPSISLGASGQTLLAFVTSAFMSLFNTHTHNDPQGGVSAVPNQQMGASHMTTTVKGG